MSQVKGINPGRLKHRITIMRCQETEDGLGNATQELAPLKSCWAELRPVRGKEQLEYFKNVNDLMYKITIRYTDVNYITNPLEDHYYLELMCTESKDHAVKEADHV